MADLSIRRRLLFSVVFILAAFLGLSAIALYELYQQRVYQSLERELQGHVYTLLSAARENEQGLPVFDQLMPDPALNLAGSGLYASVHRNDLSYRWHSASHAEQVYDFFQAMQPAEKKLDQLGDLMVLNFGVGWDDFSGTSYNYTFSVAATLQEVKQDLQNFRRNLLFWLGGGALCLVLLQMLVLNWATRPLRQAAEDIKRIENGEMEQLQGNYPEELEGLTSNINSLINHGTANQERYRKSLGDLAHSLKTPLALLQAARESRDNEELPRSIDEQLPRIDDIVQYHLQRASVMGKTTLAQAIALKPMVEKIVRGLDKVYLDKAVETEIIMDDSARFYGDEADLMELLGNLLDNAYKYCNKRVSIIAGKNPAEKFILTVEDDGPGIATEDQQRLQQRGQRADQKLPGQGIGLDIVNEIIRLYQAKLTISQSELGGACFTVSF